MSAITATVRRLPPGSITVNVVLTREFRFRNWLASQLFKLAAKVLNGKADVVIQ